MDVYDVVNKLVGEIHPVGESNTDHERFENLKVMIDLADQILREIRCMAASNQYRAEHSRKKAGEYAHDYMKSINMMT